VRVRARAAPPPPSGDEAEEPPGALFAAELAQALTLGIDDEPAEPQPE